MAKEALKQRILQDQGGECALSKKQLSKRALKLVDTDRETLKVEGGTYTDENTRIVDPVEHMKRHGTLREREGPLDVLKSAYDDRVQTMKLLLKIGNQLLAYQRRTDFRTAETEAFLEAQRESVEVRLREVDRAVVAAVKGLDDPLVTAALAVAGLGPITVAALTTYVDLEKASTPSSLWRYAGLHAASHERYVKGVAGSGGNKTLRTVLWNAACSMVKLRESGYRPVYDRVKARLEISEKVTSTRNTEGKLVQKAWKDTKPCHRHGAALRAVMKHILVDYWLVGRKLKGLPVRTIYAEAMLGHSHIESPQDHGWPG